MLGHELVEVELPILNSTQQKLLDSCYLPGLLQAVCRLSLQEDFGFLQELQYITTFSLIRWPFLQRFGVAMEEDLTF